jgi:hypothetical protein
MVQSLTGHVLAASHVWQDWLEAAQSKRDISHHMLKTPKWYCSQFLFVILEWVEVIWFELLHLEQSITI